MLNDLRPILRKFEYLFAIILLSQVAVIGGGKGAYAVTADEVLNKMNKVERHAYLAGMVEGLAYARFLRERPDETGMKCIGGWYFNDREKHETKIKTWFNRHLEVPAPALLYVLIKKECGE